MHKETEWQFDADDLSQVEAWLRAQDPLEAVEVELGTAYLQRDQYFDTPDWRLYQAGYALRLRCDPQQAEVTLKSLDAPCNGVHTRQEYTQPIDPKSGETNLLRALRRAQGGPVSARVQAAVGQRTLKALFEVHTRRQQAVLHIEGQRAGELALDEFTIPRAQGAQPMHMQRVEVELDPQLDPARKPILEQFVAKLRRACDLRPSKLSKFELGLRASQLEPNPPLDLGQPATAEQAGRAPTTGELAFAVLREHFAAFMRQEAGARIGDDPEFVHRMRVASRRLRAALRIFQPINPEQCERFRDELRWIARALGEVRDLDVQLAQVEAWNAQGGGFEPLAQMLESERDAARARLLRAFNSKRYASLIEDFSAFLRAGQAAPEFAALPARQIALSLVLRQYAAVRELGDALRADSAPEAYHALRIEVKRLRYALEFIRWLRPKAVQRFLPRLVALQDVLGDQQDAHVAAERVGKLLEQRALPEAALQTLAEARQAHEAHFRSARAAFPEAYDAIKGKRWLRLCAKLEALQRD
ncbi:MAG: CHAD domain-containing protein [Anaerolineae bacterium]|nr:CHAD domain-containing protein [Anaerolineae bacterium]